MAAQTTTKKQTINLEYSIKVSPALLFEYLSEPFRMQEWFADEVESRDHGSTYVFKWKDSGEMLTTRLALKDVANKIIRFKVIDPQGLEDWYMGFSIVITPLSKETILIVEDSVENDSREIQQQLWDFQIKKLMHILGN